jgi:hypothetical protein
MGNTVFKRSLLCILVLLVFEQSYSQSIVETKPFSFNFKKDTNLPEEYKLISFINNYELSYLKMEKDKPSFNIFLFKVNGNGKISDIYHLGDMRKTSSDAIKSRIIKTEPFWTLPKDINEYQWVAIPYFYGDYKLSDSHDNSKLFLSGLKHFEKLSEILGPDSKSLFLTPPLGVGVLFKE